MKEQEKYSEKRTRWNTGKQTTRYRVRNNGYRDSERTQWELQQHKKKNIEIIKKKTQTEIKNMLTEMKNTL